MSCDVTFDVMTTDLTKRRYVSATDRSHNTSPHSPLTPTPTSNALCCKPCATHTRNTRWPDPKTSHTPLPLPITNLNLTPPTPPPPQPPLTLSLLRPPLLLSLAPPLPLRRAVQAPAQARAQAPAQHRMCGGRVKCDFTSNVSISGRKVASVKGGGGGEGEREREME